jgi:hypothetical protein
LVRTLVGGRTETLRRSMLALIASLDPQHVTSALVVGVKGSGVTIADVRKRSTICGSVSDWTERHTCVSLNWPCAAGLPSKRAEQRSRHFEFGSS